MNAGRISALIVMGTFLSVPAAGSGNAVSLRVSPTVMMAPGYVVVRAQVESDDDNRFLEITAESDDFYRSSRIPLAGARAPRTSEVRFTGLPEGEYQITATVIGSRGQRAFASGSMLVAHGTR